MVDVIERKERADHGGTDSKVLKKEKFPRRRTR
jgi:hypothetical protein